MDKRILVPLALFALAALALTACGGGSSDEDEIVETVETVVTTSDPSNCTTLETLRFVEQNTTEKGKTALKKCKEEAEAGEKVAEGADVTNVAVSDSKATAEVKFEGGALDSQTLEMALVEEDGNWKVDYIEGFAHYDGKALGEGFERQFELEEAELTPEQSKCLGGKIAGLSQAEAEEVFFGGSAEPVIELAQSCGG